MCTLYRSSEGPTSVLGYYFDTEEVEFVNVLPREGVNGLRSIDDIDFSLWWQYCLPENQNVLCLEDCRRRIREHPPRSGIRFKHSFWIFWPNKQDRRSETYSPLIERLSNGAAETCPGPMLVVKEDQNGRPTDVFECELDLVINIVLTYA